MRLQKLVPLAAIDIDRRPLNPKTLALVDFIRAGGMVPAIHAQRDELGRWKIKDGRHRFVAFKLLGKPSILVRYWVR